MEVIISKPENIKLKDIINISYKIPDLISWINIIKEKIEDKLFKIYNDEIIYSYIKKNKKIVSFGKIINNDIYYKKICKRIWFKKWDYLIWTNLFTIKKYRWKWYAKLLKKAQIEYIKQNNPNINKLIWFTTNKKYLKLYQTYWCKFAGKYQIQDTILYIYYYNI